MWSHWLVLVSHFRRSFCTTRHTRDTWHSSVRIRGWFYNLWVKFKVLKEKITISFFLPLIVDLNFCFPTVYFVFIIESFILMIWNYWYFHVYNKFWTYPSPSLSPPNSFPISRPFPFRLDVILLPFSLKPTKPIHFSMYMHGYTISSSLSTLFYLIPKADIVYCQCILWSRQYDADKYIQIKKYIM